MLARQGWFVRHVMALVLGLLLGMPEALAERAARGTFSTVAAVAPAQHIYLSVETPYGLEQFQLELDANNPGTATAVHLKGASRPRKGRGSNSPVAATRMGSKIIIFFTSSRRGVPSSISFSIVNEGETTTARNVRYSKASARTLPCGSGAAAHHMQRAQSGTARGVVSPFGDLDSQPFSPPRVVEIATRADYDFFLRYGQATGDYIAAVLHATEVLYASSLGIRFRVVSSGIATSGVPTAGETDAGALLEAFRQGLKQEQGRADVYHLFTGRELSGRTVGIAYVRTACYGRLRFNIGLSRHITNALQPLLLAHEVGHNLGALHDSEANSIMNPVLSPSMDHFSGAARSTMKAAISRSLRCIERMPNHEAALSLANTTPQGFNATVALSSAVAESCKAALYARAMDKGKPVGPFGRISSQTVTSVAGYTGSSFSFSAPRPADPSSGAEVLFVAKVSCRSGSALTAPQVLNIPPAGSTASAPPDVKSWIRALLKSFNP